MSAFIAFVRAWEGGVQTNLLGGPTPPETVDTLGSPGDSVGSHPRSPRVVTPADSLWSCGVCRISCAQRACHFGLGPGTRFRHFFRIRSRGRESRIPGNYSGGAWPSAAAPERRPGIEGVTLDRGPLSMIARLLAASRSGTACSIAAVQGGHLFLIEHRAAPLEKCYPAFVNLPPSNKIVEGKSGEENKWLL